MFNSEQDRQQMSEQTAAGILIATATECGKLKRERPSVLCVDRFLKSATILRGQTKINLSLLAKLICRTKSIKVAVFNELVR